jgi:T5SS/PEP-CTERM-associated repeat protein
MNLSSPPAFSYVPWPASVLAPTRKLQAAPRLTGNKAWQCLLALAVVGVLPATRIRADTAYTEDFVGGMPEIWSGTDLPVSRATGTNTSWYLGQLGNDKVTLALDGLDLEGGYATPNAQGRHVFVTVSYDLFVIGGWTGNNESTPATAHTFGFESSIAAGAASKRLTTTFSNIPGQFQTFPYDSGGGDYYGQRGGRGGNQVNTLGFSGAPSGYNDAVYRLAGGRNQSFTFEHDADDLTLDFAAANLPAGATWGLTNVKVATGGVFNWQAAPAVGDGLDGGWEVGEHWANPDPTLHLSPGPDDLAQFTEAGNYNVSIHEDTSVGFLHLAASTADASTVQFNTIGHALTLTAGDYSNTSLSVADGADLTDTLFVFNSNNDADSKFNAVINAETVGVARGVGAKGTLTLDGFLDPAAPGTNNNPLGNVILNVQREMTIGDGRSRDDEAEGGNIGVATLNILHGAILNSGLGGGSASSNPGDGNTVGYETYVDGTVSVDDKGVWNQTGSIWCGVFGPGVLNVTKGSQVNLFDLPYAGQAPTIGGSFKIGGFGGSSGAVTVKDPDSKINAGDIQVANLGVDAFLAIDDFGVVNATSVAIGADIMGFPGASGDAFVNVTHQGHLKVATPTAEGQLVVGDAIDGRLTLGYVSGNDGSLFNTGQATVDFAVIGKAANVTGLVDVAYAQAADLHSLFTVNQTLTVGGGGSGTLGMNGGGVTVLAGQDLDGPICVVGDQAGSHGLITMFGGADSDTWGQGSTFDARAGAVVLGNDGSGRLEIYNGGQTFAKAISMAERAGATAELVIDGDGADHIHTTLLEVSDPNAGLMVGRGGASATAEVLNGGLLDTFRATVGGQDGEQAAGTVTVRDLRDPATLVNPEIGSLWLVHGVPFEDAFLGGTLDIGGNGVGNPLPGSGIVTIGGGGRLGVASALHLGKNGRLNVTGGAVTVGTADPLLMDVTPNSLRVVGNTTLPGAVSTVSGEGVITAEVMVESGGNLSPNGLSGTTTGSLSIVGSLRVLSGGNLTTRLSAASAGSYDTLALRDATLAGPAGTATLNNGADITLIGRDPYHTPEVGDHFDVVTAAKVVIGSLNLTFLDLPSTNWHYGVVSIPGGQALRIQYGAAVQEPGSLSIRGSVRLNGAPAAGVLIGVVPGISTLTDATGQYRVTVPSGSTGTVTPSAPGLQFSPALRAFANLTADLAAQDFQMSDALVPLLTLTAEGAQGRVTWTGVAGVTYQPQTSTDLVAWTDLAGPLPGADSPLSFTFPTTPDPKRFYRVRAER